MAYIGLPSKFVGFNTMAHRILVHLHQHGPSSAGVLAEDLRGTAREPLKAVSANLVRLHRGGFIFIVGRSRVVNGTRSSYLYGLTESRAGAERVTIKDGATRSREWRAKKALKVPSVFQFRGSMEL